MLRIFLMASVFAIAATAFGDMAGAQSAVEKAKACDRDNLVQSGTVQFSMTRIGFLVGVSWGEGVLTLNDGFQLAFDVSGGKLLQTGIATAKFDGKVFNLNNIEHFEGTYFGASTKITIIEGTGELQTTNGNCVFIRARSTGSGLAISGPTPEGLSIKFER